MPTIDMSTLKPGDVIAVQLGNKWARRFVWLHTVLTMKSAKYAHYGHIAIYTHVDDLGRHWAIEAMPKGIGWRDITDWHGHYGLTNAAQPKNDYQRAQIVKNLKELLGSRYDYSAYLHFALESLGITPLWTREYNNEEIPASFVCSAIADFEYERMQLANPGGDAETRFTTPAEWAKWIDHKGWE